MWGRALIARLVGLAATVLMALAVVVTANHYVVDVLGGLLISGLGLAVAYRFDLYRSRRSPSPVERRSSSVDTDE